MSILILRSILACMFLYNRGGRQTINNNTSISNKHLVVPTKKDGEIRKYFDTAISKTGPVGQ
jgi:hypothetical protein